MRHRFAIAAFAACLAASAPALAQDEEPEAGKDGLSLMEEGARLFYEGIMREMSPAIEDLRGLADEMEPKMRDFAREMGPALADILDRIGDISQYHPPEMLPNGDIILRKKLPEEMPPAPDAPNAPEGEIDI